MKQFLRYFWGVMIHPRATFDALANERTVRWGIVAAFLGTFQVWGNIALNALFGLDWLGTHEILADPTMIGGFGHWRVNRADYLPALVILMPVLSIFDLCITVGIAHLMSKHWRGQGTFEQMVNTLAFAGAVPNIVIGAATEWIFTAPMALLTGDPYWWTNAMAGKYGVVSVVWNIYFWGVYLGLQYAATIVLGSIAICRVQKIPAWAAVVTMTITFVAMMFLASFIIR